MVRTVTSIPWRRYGDHRTVRNGLPPDDDTLGHVASWPMRNRSKADLRASRVRTYVLPEETTVEQSAVSHQGCVTDSGYTKPRPLPHEPSCGRRSGQGWNAAVD